jgi:hypothetical protein
MLVRVDRSREIYIESISHPHTHALMPVAFATLVTIREFDAGAACGEFLREFEEPLSMQQGGRLCLERWEPESGSVSHFVPSAHKSVQSTFPPAGGTLLLPSQIQTRPPINT